jgi:lipopolysaccharide/colanic/teichoic acid biosynthesis glycosyltransferase
MVIDRPVRDRAMADSLAALSMAGTPSVRSNQFYEERWRRVELDELDEWWFLFDRPLARRAVYEATKRAIDLAAGLLGSIVVLAITPIMWIAVRLDDGGPLFFRQERVGRGGVSFRIWKFRTMRQDAEASGPVWASAEDDRVTRIGRVMRRARLDELPQFFNVLAGDMSLIGPRPERPNFVRLLSRTVPFYERRHLMRPGITGWATVRFGYGDSITDKWRSHEYDLYYLKHRSLRLDLEILLRTAVVMMKRSGQ